MNANLIPASFSHCEQYIEAKQRVGWMGRVNGVMETE